MKRIKYVHMVSGLMLFGIILSISTSAAVAWSNGTHQVGYDIGKGVRDPIPIYYADYINPVGANTKRVYYGTHDWIAESALELLYYVRPGNIFLNRLRVEPTTNKMLKIYFLYGSEIPDTYSLSPRFVTDCDYQFIRSTFPLQYKHTQSYFNGDGSPRDDTAARAADNLFHQVVLAFEAKDCQRAAAYIGAIMHVISDATMYNHVLENIGHQHTYEAHVDHVTFRKWSQGTRELWPGITEFFSVYEAQEMLTSLTSISPYMATMRAGKDTRFGGLFFQMQFGCLNTDLLVLIMDIGIILTVPLEQIII